MKKVVGILLTTVLLTVAMSSVFALPFDDPTPTMIAEADTAILKILGLLQWIGYAFALGMLIYIGIKYTMAAANEKADLKRGAINFVIGAIVIAGAATICGWIVKFGQELEGGGGGAAGGGASGGGTTISVPAAK